MSKMLEFVHIIDPSKMVEKLDLEKNLSSPAFGDSYWCRPNMHIYFLMLAKGCRDENM